MKSKKIILFLFPLLAFFVIPAGFVLGDYSGDLTGSGTCSSDTFYGAGYECDKAFDNLSITAWSSTTGSFPHWVKYDFGTTETITKFTLGMNIDGSNHSKTFEFAASNDDSTYSVLLDSIHADDNTVQTFTFSNTTAYRYYRLTFSDNWSGGTASNIYEMEMMSGGASGGGGTGSTTPADLIIYNADIYPFIFGVAAILFFLAFWITLKA